MLRSQEKIIFTNGEELSVKIIEKTASEIKFRRNDNSEGPVHIVLKTNVFSVKYPDGSIELFGPASESKPAAPTIDNFVPPNRIVLDTDEFPEGAPKKFSGPRLGFTYITSGTVSDQLSKRGKNPLVVQIGWQFEERIFTIEGGPCGLIEFIPLIGGMEQGMFLPSANLLIGLRGGSKKSIEFAMGPNVSLTGLGMVFAAGMNFRSGKINFPLNIAVVPSVGNKKDVYDANTGITSAKYTHTGWRISLTVGFNSRKR